MLDLIIAGGQVVDGTGRPAWFGDVGVRDGRIVALGAIDEPAVQVIDAHGLTVTPGFIDIHTHYDAQVFWDSTLSPSPLHGVTTVIAGNCGFTLAPLDARDADYLLRMLSRVEGMPLEALIAGVPMDWTSTAEYLERVEGTVTPNIGFLVGHSALRRVVMHDAAVEREATESEIEQMCTLLGEGLEAGGLGFSSTWAPTHNDHNGVPVPSRWATKDELLRLCEVVGRYPGTTLEFIPGVAPFSDELFELMAAMSRVADRPLNWNLLQVYAGNRDLVDHQLLGGDYASSHGGRVLALTLPDSFRTWLNFRTGFLLDLLPGWDHLMALPDDEKLAHLSDPKLRAEMDRLAQTATGVSRSMAHWSNYFVIESPSTEFSWTVGRMIGDIARELGKSPWDTLADIVVADHLRTVISAKERGQDPADWERRVEVWRDSRAVVGASDAGAHMDMIDSFSYCTTLLSKAVREHGLLPLEEAVQLLTQSPAELYGITDRGTIALGHWADLVILDPDSVGPGPVRTKYDLPSGAGRLYGEAVGIQRVFVGGKECVVEGKFTASRPGQVLRSGTDTTTVRAHAS